jgi:hypothetical protein
MNGTHKKEHFLALTSLGNDEYGACEILETDVDCLEKAAHVRQITDGNCDLVYMPLGVVAAGPAMISALEAVLACLTNVNTCDPQDIAAKVIEALKAAGYDPEALDDAAMAMLSGLAHK